MKISRLILSIILLLFIVTAANAQNWLWTADINCTNNSKTNVLTRDNNGDLLLLMEFQDTITINNRDFISLGSKDILFSKFSPDGDTIWNRTIGSTGNDIPRRLAVTDDNSIYVTGGYSGTCYLDTEVLLNTYSSEDIFLAKYNSDGEIVWAKRIAWGPDQDRSSGIVIDDNGNIAMVGFFKDSIFFENDTLVCNGNLDNFFARFDSDGNFINAILYSGTSTLTRLNEISLSNDNALLLSGFYSETFYTQTQTLVSAGGGDIIVIKVDSEGSEQWIRTAGGTSDDRGSNTSTDKYGNIFLTGYISGTVTFDSTGLELRNSSPLISKGSNDMFAAKYNKNGNLIWKINNGDINLDQSRGISVSVSNEIVQFTGFFSGTVIFGSDTLISRNNSMDAGFFIYDTEGNSIKGVSVQGSADEEGADVIYDDAGNSYLAGYFVSDTLYLEDQMIIKSASGKKNPFLAKYAIPFSASFTEVTNISCNNGSDGELIVTPYYGAAPYIYSWSHDAELNDSTATGLEAGTYTVTITDSRDSTAIQVIELSQPSAISLSLTPTNLTCNLSQDGAIDLEVFGGTVSSDYIYDWEGVSGLIPDIEDQTGLAAGWAKITVTDDNSCTAVDSVEILQPDVITFPGTVVVPELPAGSNSGSITVNPQGGTSPFNYSWEKEGMPLTGEESNVLSGISEGDYSVFVTDDNGCESDTSILVPGETFRIQVVKISEISCNGADDGSAMATIQSGIIAGRTYTYEWEDEFGGTPATLNDSTIIDLAPGKYYVTVTDNSDGARTDSDSIEITEPSVLSATIDSVDVTCNGLSNGRIIMSVSGGTPDYSYLWSNEVTTESQSNLPAGKYYVTITDANSCQLEDSIEIVEPDPLFVTISELQSLACSGDADGVLQAAVTGGNGGYSYLWNDEGTQTATIATSLYARSYNVQVTDQKGCKYNSYYNLTEPDSITFISVDTNHVSCKGTSDGSITVNPQGGTGEYTYSWLPAGLPNSNSITGLPEGPFLYELTIEDENGCLNSELSFRVNGPAATLTIQEVTDSRVDNICNGASEGALELSADGGWGDYNFSVNGTDWQAEVTFTGLSANTYTVSVRDSNNCIVTDEVTIGEPEAIAILNAEVAGASITITATGGTSPLNFSLNGGEAQSSNIFTDLANGNYTISVSDENGCGPVTSSNLEVNVTGLSPEKYHSMVNVYPNPTNGYIYINLEGLTGDDCHIEVYNMQGALVFEDRFTSYSTDKTTCEIDLSQNQKGIYILKINGVTISNRIVVE